MRRALPLVMLLVAFGCAGPKEPSPKEAALSPPLNWRSDGTTSGNVNPDWWRGFGDPMLNQVVETALAKNDDIAIAFQRVAEARANFRFAHAQLLPDIFAGAGFDRDRSINPGFGIPQTQTEGEGQIEISYDTDLFGRLSDTQAAAKSDLLASEAAQETVRLAIAASAVRGYITLRSLDARLGILRDTFAARGEELRVMRRRADVGYGTQLDLAQAEAAYHATEQLIPATALSIAQEEDGLSVLLGDAPRDIQRGTALDALNTPTVPISLPSALLRRRPDIVAAEQQLAASDHTLDAARDAFMPDFRLSAAGGLVGSTLISGSPLGIWSLGGSILAPIFSAGRLEAQRDGATARRNEAAFAYRRSALTAFREVEDSLAAIKRDGEQETALAAQTLALSRALDLATHRYREGYSPYLDQIDAERDLLTSQLAFLQARTDRLNALVTLYQSLGGGWQAPDDIPATPN
jgi:multidrug efflux system outer membrane protein